MLGMPKQPRRSQCRFRCLGESLQIVIQKPREIREHVLYGSPKELTNA